MSKLDDPTWRQERAFKAAAARTTTDHYIATLVARAPTLTGDQIERLRALLPPVDGSATS